MSTVATPPLRPPRHAQPIGGEDCFLDPESMLDELSRRLAVSLEVSPRWVVGGWRMAVTAMNRRALGEPFLVDLHAVKDATRQDVALRLSVHPSGWIEARLSVGASAPRSFFIERNYEEFEIWPPGSPCAAFDSGRMGKRCGWIQLQAENWPDIAFLAEDGFITVAPDSPEDQSSSGFPA